MKIPNIQKYKKSIFMADNVYDSKELIKQLQNIFDKTIIKSNNRNKDINKIRKLNKEDEKIYKKE